MPKSHLLDRPIREMQTRVPPQKTTQLARLGIITPRDLLYHFPRDYDDRSFLTPITNATVGQRQTFKGIISNVTSIQGGRRQVARLYPSHEDITAANERYISVSWFNQRWLTRKLEAGAPVRLTGKVGHASARKRQIMHPDIEYLDSIDQPNNPAILPIYPLTAGMSQDYLRNMVRKALDFFEPALPRIYHRPDDPHHASLHRLLAEIHFPNKLNWVPRARHLVTSDEVLEMQLALIERRQRRDSQAAHTSITVDATAREAFIKKLPFRPSPDQLRCMDEIRLDMTVDGPAMNRLLQGETGSGKTLVALAAIIDTASAGHQSAILAPTELLAEQHFNTITQLLDARLAPSSTQSVHCANLPGLPNELFTFALLTGSTKASERRTIVGQLELGIINLVIGTQAIIRKSVTIPKLALAIADEQHRFGTNQRTQLRAASNYLMLTATPIPRTLQITLYRDLDVSIIEAMPVGRKPVATTLITPFERPQAYEAIEQEVRQGRQAFVVCPLIESLDEIPEGSIEEQQAILKKRFPNLNVQPIHGQMTAKEQDRIMGEFRDGSIDILVATSIIEVGIDVPNATIMLIESAERFGMAQLHQFRGRVGRGQHAGSCWLTTTPGINPQEHTLQRLKQVAASNNGMELAIADLKHRGHGQIGGVQQSGRNSMLKTSSHYDLDILEKERTLAEAIIASDPHLARPEHETILDARNRFLERFSQTDTDH